MTDPYTAKRVDYSRVFCCPRCHNIELDRMRRGSLFNESTYIKAKYRGKSRSTRINVYCLNCGYVWRSVAFAAAERIMETDKEPSNA